MAKKRAAHDDEIGGAYRQRVNLLYGDIIAAYGDAPHAAVASVVGRDAHAEIMDAAEQGDPEALAIIRWFSRNAFVRDANAFIRRAQGTVEYHNGTIKLHKVPHRYGLRITEDDQLVITKGHQLLLWWEMTWTQFNRMVRDLQKQHGTLSERIAIFTRRILPLRAKYPETVTVEQACELEGIDPQHLVIDLHDQMSA